MLNKRLSLVSKTYTVDSIGQRMELNTYRVIFCDVKSISGQEFANAGVNGIRPECVFVIWANEYDDQEEVVYNGGSYSIYRRYLRNDGRIELYAERRVGTDGK